MPPDRRLGEARRLGPIMPPNWPSPGQNFPQDSYLQRRRYPDKEMTCFSFTMAQRAEYSRWSLSSQPELEIHGFCDASIETYGACIYVVSKGARSESH